MPVITAQDVIDQYQMYTGRAPTRAEIDRHVGQTVADIPTAARNFFLGAPPASTGEAFDIEAFLGELGGMGGMSPEEAKYMGLLTQQIEEQMRVQKEENARVKARRSALDKSIRAKYGVGLDQFEADEALRAANISRTQGERLQQALEGKLPVDPGMERQISEDEKQIRARLLEQVGPGFETSTPGIESLATFRQRAEELRAAARKGEIDAGVSPAAASAQYGLSLIGQEGVQDTTSIAQGLQASANQRNAALQAAQLRGNALLQLRDLALRERLGNLAASTAGRDYRNSSSSDDYGQGFGRLAGAAIGAGIGAYSSGAFSQQRRSTSSDPFYT